MTSFIEDIDNYILQYYSCVIEDLEERKKLINKTRFIVNRNISEFGPFSLKRLHQTLETILDNHRLRKITSLDQGLTSDGFNLYNVIHSDTGLTESNHDLKKGKELLQLLDKILSKQDFQSLIDLLGGSINATFLLGKSNLTSEDILKKTDLPDYIKWASRLSPQSVKLQERYNRFKIGLSKYNPIQKLDSINLPIVQRIISEVYKERTITLGKSLDKTGFWNLVSNEGGLTKLIEKTNPELLHKIPYLRKWNKGQKSVEIALSAIGDILYRLPGYKNAEKTNNRDEQVMIINEWITKENGLVNYFNKKGLRGLMAMLIDQTGKLGLRKAYSPKALLEFYSERKGLNWFDRTKETYVQGWRFGERNMWQMGKESAQIGIEAIEDVLYTIPGYKNAEKTNNRKEQVKIINKLIIKEKRLLMIKEKRLLDYFYKKGLRSLMSSSTTSKLGLRKSGSIKSLLEFYSERKGLDWFNPNKLPYITYLGRGKLKFIYDDITPSFCL